jgi:uncharacterized membrane protein
MRYSVTTSSPIRSIGGALPSQPVPATTPGQLDGLGVLVWPVGLLAVGVVVVAVAAAARLVGRTPGPSTADPDVAEATEATDAAEATDTSPEPVTVTLDDDEQFVVDLLLSNDGRVRQSAIVDASEWSKSKVSRLLSRMERDGHVEKVTVGRENVVVLVAVERSD